MSSLVKPLRYLKRFGALATNSRCMSQNIEKNILNSVYKEIPTLNCSVTDFLWQNLEDWPDKTATVCAVTGHGYTYAQTHKISVTFAASLRSKLRLQDNDVVAVVLPNIPEYPCVLYGILQAGCVASPMNPAYKPDEFQRLLEMVKTKAIVTCKHSYPSIIQALKSIKYNIPIVLVENSDLPEGTIKFAEFAEDFSIDTSCLKAVHRTAKDVAVIPFSSGTTGFPKGVVLTHGSVVALNQQISDREIVVIKETTANYQAVIPAVLPFFHIFGFNAVMLNQMYLGCKLVTIPYFKPELFLDTIARYKATAMFIVPPMAIFLGKHPMVTAKHLESLEGIICGAAPLSKEDAEAILAKNKSLSFRQGLGLTETNGTISIGRNSDKNLSTVGYNIANTQVKIADTTTGEALGVEQEGELWFRGPNVMSGYLDNEAATKEVLTDDGWLKTGDIAKYDEQGCIYVTDRLKELIKVKGFQVAPAEIEALIRTHPKIFDCAVIAVPDPVLGEAPKAFLVPQPGKEITEKEITDYINNKVTDYKRIKAVQFVEKIPKSAAGKILRKELKANYC